MARALPNRAMIAASEDKMTIAVRSCRDMMEANQRAVEDVWRLMETNQRGIEANQRGIEANQRAVEDVWRLMETNQRGIEANQRGIEANQRALDVLQAQVGLLAWGLVSGRDGTTRRRGRLYAPGRVWGDSTRKRTESAPLGTCAAWLTFTHFEGPITPCMA